MDIQQECITAYRRHKNLKLAAVDIGIPWQKVYVHLRSAGEPVTGDKAAYGSDKDRLAARGEEIFASLVPFAHDQNKNRYQSKIDFLVRGHGVDVKTSTLRLSNRACKQKRWAFSTKKQELLADFMVCIGIGADNETLARLLLIPGEVIRKYATLSLSEAGSKWDDYSVSPDDLAQFFLDLPAKT